MTSTPWGKFYWSDWMADPALRLCSLSGQGLWMRMLCVAAESDPTGFVTVNGRPLDGQDLARLTGVSVPEVEALLSELDRNGVFSRDGRGRIYSRRMVRDAKRAAIAKKNGKTGGNPSLRKDKDKMPLDIPPDKPRDNTQKPEAIFQKNPPNPQGGGRPLDILLDKLIGAAGGKVVHNSLGIEVVTPILDLQAMGCDLDADILPAISEWARGLPGPIKTWAARPLRDRALEKMSARRQGRGGAGPAKPEYSPEIWDGMVARFKRTGAWNDRIGKEPGHPGCPAPPDILAKHGFSKAA